MAILKLAARRMMMTLITSVKVQGKKKAPYDKAQEKN